MTSWKSEKLADLFTLFTATASSVFELLDIAQKLTDSFKRIRVQCLALYFKHQWLVMLSNKWFSVKEFMHNFAVFTCRNRFFGLSWGKDLQLYTRCNPWKAVERSVLNLCIMQRCRLEYLMVLSSSQKFLMIVKVFINNGHPSCIC